MSTISGKENEELDSVSKKYRGCDWDGVGCTDDYDDYYGDCYDHGVATRESSVCGRYVNGVWVPTPAVPVEPPKVIEYTEEELKEVRRKFATEKSVMSALREKTEKTEELFKYIEYVSQEFKKLQKASDTALEEVERLERLVYYSVVVNKSLYYCEYEKYDQALTRPFYIARRIGLKVGDIIGGYSSTTKMNFGFFGGMVLKQGISDGDFVFREDGYVICNKEGIYDIEILISYGKDCIYIQPTKGECNKLEVAERAYNRISLDILSFSKNVDKLHDKLTNILDKGSDIDQEILSKALKCWQTLERIVKNDTYEPYEKKVSKYGTSY